MIEAGMTDCQTFDDRASLDAALAAHVAARLREALTQREQAFLVLSGGSTPVNLLELLSMEALDWHRVIVLLADERWVDACSTDRNEHMIRQQLLQNQASAAEFLPLITTLDDQVGNIASLNTLLASLPTFDVVILGMGEDGHTASLFPCARELKEGLATPLSALVTRPTQAPHERVSLSRQRLQNSREIILHIVGDTKRRVFQDACISGDPSRFPIAAFTESVCFNCYWAP